MHNSRKINIIDLNNDDGTLPQFHGTLARIQACYHGVMPPAQTCPMFLIITLANTWIYYGSMLTNVEIHATNSHTI